MKRIPYGSQCIQTTDLAVVTEALQEAWITGGPRIGLAESQLASYCGVKRAVLVNSGTAALHAIYYAIGVGPGDEVIVPALTFAATANAVRYLGGVPVFADVRPSDLTVDIDAVKRLITGRTKAIVTVDYAGHASRYSELLELARSAGVPLISDACHAIGATYQGYSVGSLADLSSFSFHPVKHITSGEGGAVVTNNFSWANTCERFRNHGIVTDLSQRLTTGAFAYDVSELGFNYRLTAFQAALLSNQLLSLNDWVNRRREIAQLYRELLAEVPEVLCLEDAGDSVNSYHLFVIRVPKLRNHLFQYLFQKNILCAVHYKPVYQHSFYQNSGYPQGTCPIAEKAYSEIISIPIFPSLTNDDVRAVVQAIKVGLKTSN